MFGPQMAWPVIPLHATVARNGHLVTFGTPLDTARQGGVTYDDWDPALGTARSAHTQAPSMHGYDSFCNGAVTLPDGRILMVGGNSTTSTMTYDPVSRSQTMGANLARQRWYASALRLADDRVLVLGGANYYNTGAYRNPGDNSGVATVPEIGTGTGAWTSLTGATSTMAFGALDNRWWYPRAFNGPNGTVVGTSGDQVWRMSTSGTGSITRTATLPFNPRVSGSQVMYAPNRILVAGGGQPFNEDGTAATNRAAVVDVSGSTVRVTSTASMASARNWLNLSVLLDGRVLASGGTAVGTQGGTAVRRAEIWNPATGTWTAAATAQRTRTYHSTALLMPSGAVFTGGGGVPGPEDNLNAEMYYPPSLFTRGADGVVRWASRPTITTLAGSATYGGQLTLGMGDARTVREASLVSLGSVTHSYQTDERRIPLAVTQNGASVRVMLPTSASTLPPGDYLLSTVDSAGVPSPGQVLTINRSGAGTVTVGTTQTATGGSGTTTPPTGSVPLTAGTSVGLEAVNFPGYRVRHGNFQASLSQVSAASSGLDQADSSFVVRPGLAGSAGVSLEAVNYPGLYLRTNGTGGRVTLTRPDGSAAAAAASTFRPVTGLTGQNTSLELWSSPGVYLRHQDFQLFAQASDGGGGFRADATFAVRAGLAGAPAAAVLQGEGGALTGSAVVWNGSQGWTGTGYVANLITTGSSTTVTANRPAAGPVTLTVRYAGGGGGPTGPRTLGLLVNGQRVQTATFAATADWNSWALASAVVDLPAGNSTVGIVMGQGDTGWIDVDAITVG
jgi:hypothetical protein